MTNFLKKVEGEGVGGSEIKVGFIFGGSNF